MKLLKYLYTVHSPSHHEESMIQVLSGWCKSRNIPCEKDAHGNLLITKGVATSYPCIVAHMDEVHRQRENDFHVHQDGNIIYGFSAAAMGLQGIGADDKNGIWVALKALELLSVVKVAFFVGEEVGCIGSSKVDLGFFDNCRFVIQCDRKNGFDFINTASGVSLCNKDFFEAMDATKYGYHLVNGLMTDVMELRERGLSICACNLSCGYYNPHTDDEVTNVDELHNCLDMVLNACTKIRDICPMEVYTPPARGGFGFWPVKSSYNQNNTIYESSLPRVNTQKACASSIVNTSYMFDDALDYEEDVIEKADVCRAASWWSLHAALAELKTIFCDDVQYVEEMKDILTSAIIQYGSTSESFDCTLSRAYILGILQYDELVDILYLIDQEFRQIYDAAMIEKEGDKK